MRQLTGFALVMLSFFIFFLNPVTANDRKEYKQDFPAVGQLSIKLFSGNCLIKKSDSNQITVHITYQSSITPFTPKITPSDEILVIQEEKTMIPRNAQWTVSVPADIDIVATLVLNDLVIEGIHGDIYAKSVSGNVSARNCRGNIRLGSISGGVSAENLEGTCRVKGIDGVVELIGIKGDVHISAMTGDVTAVDLNGNTVIKANTGEVRIKRSTGAFNIKNAAGDIAAEDLSITGESTFKVVSGDIAVGLAQTPNVDIQLATTSGNAVLNYNGNPLKGTFLLRVMSRTGTITAPYEFDNADLQQEKWGKSYRTKTFTKDTAAPSVQIIASTGNAVLKDK